MLVFCLLCGYLHTIEDRGDGTRRGKIKGKLRGGRGYDRIFNWHVARLVGIGVRREKAEEGSKND